MPYRKRRCELATPAISSKMIEKALRLEVDQVFLDLEDSIPVDRKVEARENAIAALSELDWSGKTRAVRINNVRSPWCYRDIIDVVVRAGANLDSIIVPKVKSADELIFCDLLLDQLEAEYGYAHQIGLECLIETPEALEFIQDIAFATPRLETLIFGAADFASLMGVPVLDLNDYYSDAVQQTATLQHPWYYALNRFAIAGRAAGLQLIGGSFPGYNEERLANYQVETKLEVKLGFDGKWAIHPNQVPIAMAFFTPAAEETAKAKRLIEAYREETSSGRGAFLFEGQMVDAATVEVAEKIVLRSDQIE